MEVTLPTTIKVTIKVIKQNEKYQRVGHKGFWDIQYFRASYP